MVLVSFSLGNDIQESYRSSKKKWLQTYSYSGIITYRLFQLFSKTSSNFKNQYSSNFQNFCDTCSTFTQDAYLELESKRSFIFNKDSNFLKSCLDSTRFYLKEMKALYKSKNIKNGCASYTRRITSKSGTSKIDYKRPPRY